MTAISTLTKVPQTIRNLQRFRQIISIIAKHGFDDLITRLNIDSYLKWTKRVIKQKVDEKVKKDIPQYTIEEKIRMIFEELGPTFIKLGQILATRPDLIPISLVNELRKLQDKVPPFSSQEAKAQIERELNGKIEDLFTSFEEKPLAAASIAQVHVAYLKSGEKVVIKVQRPNLEKIISTDLDILQGLAKLLEERIPESKQYNPVGIVEEFSKSIIKEIDFTREMQNILKFANNFKNCEFIYTPKVYKEYSTSKVLTMEFIDGIKGYDFAEMDRQGYDRKLLAERGTEAVMQMIFVDGFFHADPHPGNIFVLPGNVICFIDYGMMGTVDDERIDELLTFLVAILTVDLDKMVSLFYRLGLIDESVNVRAMKSELKMILERYYNLPLKEIDVAVFIQEVFEVVQRFHVVMPSDLLLMGKAMATMEGIAQELYPEYDPINHMRGFLLKIYLKRITDPAHLAKDLYRNIDEIFYIIKKFPKDIDSIITKLRKGELSLILKEEENINQLIIKNKIYNRMMIAILILSLTIGGPLLLIKDAGPIILGFHMTTTLGLIWILLSAIFIFILVVSILRSGGL